MSDPLSSETRQQIAAARFAHLEAVEMAITDTTRAFGDKFRECVTTLDALAALLSVPHQEETTTEIQDHGAGLIHQVASPLVETEPCLTLQQADQAVWDAAWALHDPDPRGQQWRRSKALKDAIDALIAAVRAEQEDGWLKGFEAGYTKQVGSVSDSASAERAGDRAGAHAQETNSSIREPGQETTP